MAALSSQSAPPSILGAAHENHCARLYLDEDTDDPPSEESKASILQPATFIIPPSKLEKNLLFTQTKNDNTNVKNAKSENSNDTLPQQTLQISIGSEQSRMAKLASNATRNERSIRQKLREKENLLRTVFRSLSSHRKTNARLKEQMNNILEHKSEDFNLDSHQTKKMECERVISQLERDSHVIKEALQNIRMEYKSATSIALSMRRQAASMSTLFLDPTQTPTRSFITSGFTIPPYSAPYFVNACSKTSPDQTILQSLSARQFFGGGGGLLKRRNNMIGKRPSNPLPLSSVHKSFSRHRIAHTVTINSHLVYPVYCMCFDRTGRYFVTGADDHLVKLFYLGGANASSKNFMTRRSTYDMHQRGAVLVCTLRGHAGVVTDIDISADNALLASASEDGSCRIWGLHDGCPVAVLRGHVGGANMVRKSIVEV